MTAEAGSPANEATGLCLKQMGFVPSRGESRAGLKTTLDAS